MPGRLDQAPEKKTLGDAETALEECTALEADLAELRAAYEQYFLGVERHPPVARHDALKRRMNTLKGLFLRQTALKFRIQTLSARLTTFERLWDRSLKEIEAGTYRRDLNRAKRHLKERAKEKQPAAPQTEDLDLSDLDVEPTAERPAATLPAPPAAPTSSAPTMPPAVVPPPLPATSAARPPAIAPILTPPSVRPPPPVITPALPQRPQLTPARGSPSAPRQPPAAALTGGVGGPTPPPTGGGLTDQKIKAIYDAYVMAKRRCGEDTKGLTFDSVATTLRKQVPELMKQHQAKSVEFKVVIKDGRAVLRALPRDS